MGAATNRPTVMAAQYNDVKAAADAPKCGVRNSVCHEVTPTSTDT